MFSGCLTINCLRSFRLVKSRDFVHLAALGLVSMMLHYAIGNIVRISRPYRDAQAALERQDLSCTYLAHHELESVKLSLLSLVLDAHHAGQSPLPHTAYKQ